MIWKPHATVSAIIEKDGKFLLIEELIDGIKVLNQPSGHIEPDESFANAVIRETQEEAAVVFQPEYIVGLYRWVLNEKERTYIRLCFSGKMLRTLENQPLDTDIIRTLWLSYEEIIANKEQLRSPMVLECIDDYLKGSRFSLELLKDLG
ncbi:MAG: NUDIX hydrolase [Gammaproteobacteria bacterium]|nr:NUDIX hydrolase [Gammaproteobacteria bacterium]